MDTTANDWPVRPLALSCRTPKRLDKPAVSPADTEYFDIVSPPPGARVVINNVNVLTSRETKTQNEAARTETATLSSSRLNPTPQRIAVYASQLSSPTTTQHSLPGGPLRP